MALVRFTANLARHVEAGETQAAGGTVAEVLTGVFAQRPRLRSYVLDDQGGLRHHLCIFVDGQQIHDRRRLSDRTAAGAVIDVIQALSGG